MRMAPQTRQRRWARVVGAVIMGGAAPSSQALATFCNREM